MNEDHIDIKYDAIVSAAKILEKENSENDVDFYYDKISDTPEFIAYSESNWLFGRKFHVPTILEIYKRNNK